jgi:Uma2 family endonuclease
MELDIITLPEMATEPRLYTVEEYLTLEEMAEERSEYDNGKIKLMAGGTFNHSRITANCIREIGNELIAAQNKTCFVSSSDLKIYVAAQNKFYYPDCSVVCGEPQYCKNREDIIDNPTLIVEVLSDSTESFDRTDKFDWYSTLPTFKEYLLVSQKQKRAEVWTYVGGNVWEMRVFKKSLDKIVLKTINCEIELDNLYLGLGF